ncbi:MAG: hypothetical protein ACLVIW_14770, partial [Bilophila wadsworthia]
ACNIGGATLKAMCVAAKKPLKMQDVTSLTGLRFPVRVKINPRPTCKDDGREYWNNEMACVITPDKEAYATVTHGGEIITDGPVTGNAGKTKRQAAPEAGTYGMPFPSENAAMDDVPF